MNILEAIKQRFTPAIGAILGAAGDDAAAVDIGEWLDLIRPAQDPKFGDYQANFAMPLGKKLGKPPRDVAAAVVEMLDLGEWCEPPEIAGPGFINLRIRDDALAQWVGGLLSDESLGVSPAENPGTYVVDFSSPNVAKPMHVGHIRSTVIGDCVCRLLRRLGHTVISDNHLGDWGTQFGMIIYGYRHFLDAAAYRSQPAPELLRIYRLVRKLIDYHEGHKNLPTLATKLQEVETAVAAEREALGPSPKKAAKKALAKKERSLAELCEEVASLNEKLAALDADNAFVALAKEHANIAADVLAETARLHEGDPENQQLWEEVLPGSRDEIDRVYRRLDVDFDETLGESFYHDQLAPLVERLIETGVARESDGAICIFLEGSGAPMIVRKRDGAFLYATTDLATIEYRIKRWNPTTILYVVGAPQGLHFQQLFVAARRIGHTDVELAHVAFGSVLGEDGRMFKTRSGDTVGLEGLIDEAVARAHRIVCESDDAKPGGPELSEKERREIAEIVGVGAIKYCDLSHNRESDYVFSYDKMLAMNGNTATYLQYAYARVQSIFAKGGITPEAIRRAADGSAVITLKAPAERALAIAVARYPEALAAAAADYRPNLLTAYLFGLAETLSTFYNECPVLKAEDEATRLTRLRLCDLTARTLADGLAALGIKVAPRM